MSLATPDALACRSCGFSGAPDPRVVVELRGAWAALLGIDARRRQLSDLGRREIARASTYTTLFHLIWGMGVLAATLWAALYFLLVRSNGSSAPSAWWSVVVALDFFSPLALLLGSGLFVRSRLRRRLRGVLDAAAAAPPAAPGEPARCYLCGGPVVAGSGAVVRCGYCATDNVVDDAVVARVARRDVEVADGFARAIVALAPASSDAGFSALGFLLTFTFGMPLVVFVLTVAFSAVATSVHKPADMTRRYVVVERNGHRCVGAVTKETDKLRIELGGNPPSDFAFTEVLDAKDTTPIKLEELRGRRVALGSRQGTVVGFEQNMYDENELVLDDGSKPPVSGACLIGP